MTHHTYNPKGVCAMQIEYDLDDNNKIHNLEFIGGCNGNLKAVSRLVDGMTVEEIVAKLSGITCGRRPTSCGDQLALALEEAKIAAIEGEIPVGVVIVRNNEVLSANHNRKEQLKCSTKHAEIIAIEEVSNKIEDWRLNDCEMYVTMEPCLMCCGALIQSRIKKIYYLVNNEKFGGIKNVHNFVNFNNYNHHFEIIKYNDSILEEEMRNLLKEFFSSKR